MKTNYSTLETSLTDRSSSSFPFIYYGKPGTNLLTDNQASMETDGSDWAESGGTLVRTTDQKKYGTACMKLTCGATEYAATDVASPTSYQGDTLAARHRGDPMQERGAVYHGAARRHFYRALAEGGFKYQLTTFISCRIA